MVFQLAPEVGELFARPAVTFKVTLGGRDPWGGDLCKVCASLLREQFPGSNAGRVTRSTFEHVLDLDAGATMPPEPAQNRRVADFHAPQVQSPQDAP